MGDFSEAQRRRRERMLNPDFNPSEYPASAAPESGNSSYTGARDLFNVGLPVVGGALGGAVAGPAGAVAGAGAGGALAGGMDPDRSALGGAAVGAASELGGQVLGRYVVGPLAAKGVHSLSSALGSRFPRIAAALGRTMRASQVEEGADVAQELLRARGATLTVGQASKAQTLDTLENIAENSLIGGPVMAGAKANSQRVARQYLDDYVRSYATTGSRADRAAVVQSAVENLADSHNVMVGRMFDDVDQVLGNAAVDRRPVALLAQQILDKTQLRKTLGKGSVGSILRDVANGNGRNFLTFGEAQSLRSELLAAKRALSTSDDVMKGPAAKWLNDITDAVTEQMEVAGKRLDPATFAKYEEARALWRHGHELWNNDFINKIVGQESPEVLFEAAVKAGRPTNIARLREALLAPPRVSGAANLSAAQGRAAWESVQGTAVKDLMERATDPVSKQLDGAKLLRVLDDFGDDAAKELLPGTGFDTLRQYARTLYLTQKTAGSGGTGTVAIQLMQPGAVLQLGTAALAGVGAISTPLGGGAGTGLAATVVLGPAGMAKAFTDKRFVDYFSRGLAAPIGSVQASRITAQIMGRLTELGLMDRGAIQGTDATQEPYNETRTSADLYLDQVRRKVRSQQQ